MRELPPHNLADPEFLDRVRWFVTYATDRRSRLKTVAERFQLTEGQAAAVLSRLGLKRLGADEQPWRYRP